MKLVYIVLGLAAAGLVVTTLFVVNQVQMRTSGGLLRPNDSQIIANGARIYQGHCTDCHGPNLEGQPNWRQRGETGLLPAPPHDASGHTWHHTDDVLFGITKYGLAKFAGLDGYETNMPIYEDALADEEIIAVLSFIKAQWPKELQASHDEMNAAAVR